MVSTGGYDHDVCLGGGGGGGDTRIDYLSILSLLNCFC